MEGDIVTDSRFSQKRRRLIIVRWVAVVDLLLLIGLVTASLTGNRELVRILGPIHGGNFLLLCTIAAVGAFDGFWRWWLPAIIFLTGGPVGALIGEWYIGRQIHHEISNEGTL
jgi:hypothetical protein